MWLEYPEFNDFILKYDIICFAETKLDNTDVISCDGYTFFNKPRRERYLRKSGGLGFLVRNEICKHFSFVDAESEYVAWLKIRKSFQHQNDDLVIGSVYIPPQQSQFFSNDEFECFEQEITSVCSSNDSVYIMGDFNAQTSTLEDYTSSDEFLSKYFDFDESTIEFYDQRCALEKLGVQLRRISKDTKKNNSGFRLIDLCKNHNLTILNGRFGQDKTIGKMTFRNSSVIDYALVSLKSIETLLDFQIIDLDRLFSDGHCLLRLDIKLDLPNEFPQPQTPRYVNKPYLKQSEYESFENNIDPQKIGSILSSIQACENTQDTNSNSINDIVSQISSLFKISATVVESSRKKFVTEKKSKPWFGHKCKNARKKYYLAKKIHKRYSSDYSQKQLLAASKSYKKTMNKFINKHIKQRQNTLRRMQKSDPKAYWKYLNSLKGKKVSKSPSLEDFFHHFSEVYSSEQPQDQLNMEDINLQDENNFLNRKFTADEIEKCISKLNNNKACGFDEIINEYIKVTKSKMLPIYVGLFNLILNTGTIPEIWSHGKIMPIYKNSGNSTDPNNYRPISILSCLGKLFTALLSERLNTFMEEDEILKENQAGFRKHYSTTDHIFSLYSLLEILKYEKKKLFCSFIDLSKAFDSVW